MPRGTYFINTTSINAVQNTDIVLAQVNLTFYNKNKLKQLSEASQKEYKYIVNSFIRWAGESTLLSAISIITLDDYSEYKLAEGIKPVSMATILRHLRRFFNFCASRNYMQPLYIEMPRVEQEIKEPYTT